MQNPFENISPQNYSEFSVVARESALQIISRLDLMSLQPKIIIDIGCGVAGSSHLLKKRYPDAKILAVDSNISFLQYAKKNQPNEIDCLCADAYQLPLKEYGIDLVFANLLLPWCHDIKNILQEWQRVLNPNGLLMFSTLGPDTLRELPNHLLHLMDMHNIGDALMQAGFLDPVLDLDYLKVTYRSQMQLVHELQTTGFLSMVEKLPENVLSVTYEIVYGHAWGSGVKPGYMADEYGEVRIPLSAVKR